ncbi:MAG: hypothetical protein ACOX87_15225 [Chloroflexota bacterium]|jgi:hypothetical protein
MSPVLDALVLFLVLLPAIVLIALIIHSAMPWLSKSWRDAEERAELLIRSLLTEEDYRKLRRDGYLDIPSPNYPQRVYRVPSGAGTVAVLEGGQCIARLCLYSTQPIPEKEAVLIHKLMIEGNEQEYLRTANHLPC